ncbi:hypothetical protein PHLCEN_2v212 [Hermanssonia centrifuga]|uniref:GH15-like domain-containing protein n=1 Tax=Hermanssonia centrifuga TaxID=98765 RepID=A0A2R6S6S0_9APHY|nr:hypothetical protein PHLCEN_2v212 [Hermanssonia centrifuga]
MRELFEATNNYWNAWIRRSTYQGSWKEAVNRSALALKLLIYEPTGAVIASPTFSLPEYIGGTRNWDYRASWIRDSSFTLYALIRLGFTHEANDYMDFIFDRVKQKNDDGSLKIMIGNGAIDHVQLDIYGELYGQFSTFSLGQANEFFSEWIVFILGRSMVDHWVAVRELEVRGKQKHFTYSKGSYRQRLLGIRLAEKRSFPCPRRNEWITARDTLYEQIMEKAWNKELQFFGQSYEDTDVLDSSLLIMPLVFFSTPADPRFLNTLKRILLTPERGGLTSNGLVYRYDVSKSDDGVGGEEGTFCLCTLWCIEALARAGEYDKPLLARAVAMFEDFLQYTNHVGLCTEEISPAGDGLGNAVQGFTHVTLISAAYNLSRMQGKFKV